MGSPKVIMNVSEEFYSKILSEVRKEIQNSDGNRSEINLSATTALSNRLHEMGGNKESEPKPMDLRTSQELVCNDCGETYRGTRNSAADHIMCKYQVASRTPRSFICEEEGCSSNAFSTAQGLKLHMNQAHLKIKYPCWECPYQATQLGNLKRHVRRKHDKFQIKEHVCHKCGSHFTTKWGLIEHDKAIHMKIRDLICKVCGDTFSRMKCLSVHMERMHRQEQNTQT